MFIFADFMEKLTSLISLCLFRVIVALGTRIEIIVTLVLEFLRDLRFKFIKTLVEVEGLLHKTERLYRLPIFPGDFITRTHQNERLVRLFKVQRILDQVLSDVLLADLLGVRTDRFQFLVEHLEFGEGFLYLLWLEFFGELVLFADLVGDVLGLTADSHGFFLNFFKLFEVLLEISVRARHTLHLLQILLLC